MKMDRRLTNGLAWAGALLVIGVPAADYLSGAFAGQSNPNVAVVDAEPEAVTAAVTPMPAATVTTPKPAAPVPQSRPAEIVTGSTGTAVDSFLQSGKPLPSYITDGGKPAAVAATPTKPVTQPAATPQPSATQPTAAPQTAATQPTPTTTPPATEQVAALPQRVAPTPMPLSMRPKPITVPLANDQPLIVNEAAVPSAPVVPVQNQGIVTAQDLEDWESGPLADFLARRGQQNSTVTYNVQRVQPEPAYDDNGFWLDQGPNGDRPSRRLPRDDEEVYYLPF